jgi:hypothetical protein
MRKTIGALLLCVMSSASMQAQTPNSEAREAMKRVSFMIGQWKGEGWAQFGPGQRQTVTALESVQLRLGGEVLLIEGLGKNKDANHTDVVGHDALAFLYYDEKARIFRFQAHRAGGIHVDTEAKLIDRGFSWSFQDERAGTLRFTMKLTDKGEWFEIGEASRDGKSWFKFFEMTLQRVK